MRRRWLAAVVVCGIVVGCRPRRLPVDRPETPGGVLEKEAIRGVVRERIGDVRACYEEALRYDPELEGRVEVQFIIGPQGKVEEAVVASSEFPRWAAFVGKCMTRAVQTWEFPAPRGGDVVVTYPFVLSPRSVADGGTRAVEAKNPVGQWIPMAGHERGTLLVEVRDSEDRQPLEGAEVILRVRTERGQSRRSAQTDAAGQAVFANVVPGAWVGARIRDAERGSEVVELDGRPLRVLLLFELPDP